MTVQKHDTKGFELYLVFQKLRGDVELRSDFETQAMSDDIDDLAVIIVNKATFRALMSQFNDTVQKRASQIMSNN